MASSVEHRARPSSPRHDEDSRSPRRSSHWLPRLPDASRVFLEQLVQIGLVPLEAADPFLEQRAERLREYAGEVEVGQALIESGLLTSFQLDRVLSGHVHGLMLGNYRVLDQIGSGGMGLVFLGEHRLM